MKRHRARGKKRLFWLGMHKILKPTELRRLRELGYEVFNPPYISPIYDQSADRSVDSDQPTTLPKDVFDELIAYDFFYKKISTRISELLNEYFDAAVVTINPDWLIAFADAYDGPLFYRVYGQPYSLSNHFQAGGHWERIVTREDFRIIPFADESVAGEAAWFRDLCTEHVPYQIPDDVFSHSGEWGIDRTRPEIVTSIPNIENPYYGAVYHEFYQRFTRPYLRVLGPQRDIPADPRILGALPRERFLRRLAESRGFLYPYRGNVCYLAPIEMMEIGGPVVYLRDSLLDRFNDPDNPGAAADADEALGLLDRLVKPDTGLAKAIIEAQEVVRLRYDRSHVQPIFDRVFGSLLSEPHLEALLVRQNRILAGPNTNAGAKKKKSSRKIFIPLHVDGLYHYVGGEAVALEGIPRVVDAFVDTLVTRTDCDVVVSCTLGSAPVLRDFFRGHIATGRVQIRLVDLDAIAGDRISRLQLLSDLNSAGDEFAAVIVPHYYLFPEYMLYRGNLVLYLPDYFPHLMPDVVFDGSAEKDAENKAIGTTIARKSSRILTNSNFTKSYLPDADFVDEAELEKVIVAPLPVLGESRGLDVSPSEREFLKTNLGSHPYLFYPTANRPNKRLAFFVRLLAHLRLTYGDLRAVLTCSLDSVPEVRKAVVDYGLTDEIILSPGASEGLLRWYYRNCRALCLTSVAEGNFPPQVLEALVYEAPVVATRLPTITELLGGDDEQLLLCEPVDLADFADKLGVAISERERILSQQSAVLAKLRRWNSPDEFAKGLARLLPNVRFSRSTKVRSADA